MKRFYKLLFAILLFPIISTAQSNYKPGYAINLKGDTLKGFINYKEWSQNPSAIDFKTAITDKAAKRLTTDDIKGFNIAGYESYQKYTGPISTDYIDASHVSNGKDTTFKIASVFLKVLIEGKNVSLLAYADDIRPHFYVEDGPHEPKELVYHVYNQDDAQTGAVKTAVDNGYVTQLYFLAQKYNVLTTDLQHDLEHMGYYANDIMKIVSAINGVSKEEFKQQHINDTPIDFFVSAGADVSNLKPFGRYKTSGANPATAVCPELSFGINLSTHAETRFQLRVEGIISGNKYNSIYIYTGSPYIPTKYSFDQLWLAITPQVIYNVYNGPKFKIFVGLGLALTYDDYYNGKYDINYAATQVTNGKITSKSFFSTFTDPIMFKLGAKISNRLDVFAAYFTNSAVSSDYYFEMHFDNTQVGLDYHFK